MGQPKALLPWGPGGPPFVVHVVQALRDAGVDDIVVTVPEETGVAATVREVLWAFLGGAAARAIALVANPWPHLGLSGSVRAALLRCQDDHALLVVAPVDAPFFDAALARALIARALHGHAGDDAGDDEPGTGVRGAVDVTVPVVAVAAATEAAAAGGSVPDARSGTRGPVAVGTRGHPAVFARTCFADLQAAADHGGPRNVVDEAARRRRLATVSHGDPRIATDVDTPADWERAFSSPWSGR